MVKRVGAAVGKNKTVLPVPIGVMRLGATMLDWLPAFPVTRDQLTMLAQGNTAPPGGLHGLLGHAPRTFGAENLAYLRRSP